MSGLNRLRSLSTAGVLVLVCTLQAESQEDPDFRTPTQTVEEQLTFLSNGIRPNTFP